MTDQLSTPAPDPMSPEQHLQEAENLLAFGATAPADAQVATANIALAHSVTGLLALLLRQESQS